MKIYFRIIKREKSKKNKILVVLLGHFGDLVHAIPLLKNMRMNNAGVEITLVTGKWNKELVVKIPWINDVIYIDTPLWNRGKGKAFISFLVDVYRLIRKINRGKYSLGIDLRGHINSLYILYFSNIREIVGFDYKGHGLLLDKKILLKEDIYEKDRLLSVLSLLEYKEIESNFNLVISNRDIQRAQFYLEGRGFKSNQKLVGFFPGAPFNSRRWPAEKYAKLADLVSSMSGYKSLIIGGIKDKAVVESVCFAMKSKPFVSIGNDVGILMGLFKMCNCLVANDTGPLHLAVALGVPTIALFGPGNHLKWAPRFPHVTFRKNVSCSPCRLEQDVCPNPNVKCMEKIEVEDVFSSLQNILSEI